MDKLPPKPKKVKGSTSDELLKLDKNELAEKILQLEAHNLQLKNVISKQNASDCSSDGNHRKRMFDFNKCNYRHILLNILYFGWDYQGLATQEDSTQTIEHHLFHALTKSCLIEKRETSNYHRCGRTDKGVSSFGQVISINIRSKYTREDQYKQENIDNEMPYCKILNRLLPSNIRAISWTPIPKDDLNFSARFNCKKRLYKYYFPKSNLNLSAMLEACGYLVGCHDYRNLCKMDVGNGVTQFVREVISADILPVDDGDKDLATSMYYLRLEGNAFLWHQIRCIFGVLLLIGTGLELPQVVKQLLDIQSNPCKPQYNMALDVPLNLFHCTYELDNEGWVHDRDELRRVITELQGSWTIQNIKATMIKDCLNSLEDVYARLQHKSETELLNDKDRIYNHTECLLQGVKPKVYKPLLKRHTCSSLEDRIEHYKKKRKILPSDTPEGEMNS